MNSKNRVLFIIDAEKDFIDGGALAVNGSKPKMDALAKYIIDTKGKYSGYFASEDWHPSTHCSFKENGGIWPTHCRQFSDGAAIYKPILDALDSIGADLQVFTKGTNEDREEYSVMKNEVSNKAIHAYIDAHGITEADFCGLAGDYCVRDSMADFHREFPKIKITALLPFIQSIDGGTALNEFLKKNDEIDSVE